MPGQSLLPALTLGFGILAIAVTWFGVLAALLVALGKRQWLWAIPMILLGPIVALPYTLKESDAAYARRLVVTGLILFLPAALLFVLTGIVFRAG